MNTRKGYRRIIFTLLCMVVLLLILTTLALSAPVTHRKVTPISVYDISYMVNKAKGNVVFVRVYAMYCPACRNDLPDMNQLAYYYGQERVTFINVCVDDEPRYLENLVTTNEIYFEPYFVNPYPKGQLTANIQKLGGNYPGKIPYTILLDRQGRKRLEFTGGYSAQEYCKVIDQLLREN